jgi:hypothetical protein
VAAFELDEADVVAALSQPRHERAAGPPDGQDVVGLPMGDEHRDAQQRLSAGDVEVPAADLTVYDALVGAG